MCVCHVETIKTYLTYNFTYTGVKNSWTDRNEILIGVRAPRRSYLYKVEWWSVQPFLYGERSNFRFSHWLWLSSLRARAFQRAKDESHTLPLSPKDGQEMLLYCFTNKTDILSIKLCYLRSFFALEISDKALLLLLILP